MCALCGTARPATLVSMHTHFGSATHLASTFLGVLLAGTLWRIGNLRILAYASKRNNKHLAGLAQAALGQY